MKLRAKLIKPYHSLQLYEYYEICWNERNSFIKNAGGDHGIYTCDIVKYFDEITHVQEDPYKELKEAYNNGREIEYSNNNGRTWLPASTPSWSVDLMYRIKPIDPYKELKEAHARGEDIEVYKTDNRWSDIKYPKWDVDVSKYRIKPKPVYIPFDLSDDIIGRVVVDKVLGHKFIITGQVMNKAVFGTGYKTYNTLLSDYLFADGTVCGKLQ